MSLTFAIHGGICCLRGLQHVSHRPARGRGGPKIEDRDKKRIGVERAEWVRQRAECVVQCGMAGRLASSAHGHTEGPGLLVEGVEIDAQLDRLEERLQKEVEELQVEAQKEEARAVKAGPLKAAMLSVMAANRFTAAGRAHQKGGEGANARAGSAEPAAAAEAVSSYPASPGLPWHATLVPACVHGQIHRLLLRCSSRPPPTPAERTEADLSWAFFELDGYCETAKEASSINAQFGESASTYGEVTVEGARCILAALLGLDDDPISSSDDPSSSSSSSSSRRSSGSVSASLRRGRQPRTGQTDTHAAEMAATSSNASRSNDVGPSAASGAGGSSVHKRPAVFLDLGSGVGKMVMLAALEGQSVSRSIGVELCMTRHARAVLARERLLACVDTAAERARCEAIELIQDDMLTSHGAVASAVSACTHVFLSSLLFNVETMHRLAEILEGAEQLVAVATLQEFPPDCRWSFVSIAAQTVQARMDWHSRAKEGSDVFIYRRVRAMYYY